MRYTGIVFDFNGTLLWDSDKHEYAWRILSEQLRGRAFTDEEIRSKVHGRVNRVILEYLVGHALDDETAARLADQKEQIYLELCEKDGEAFALAPGAVELLDYLTEKRIPHAIGTSSCEPNVRYYLEKFYLLRWFPMEHIIFDDGKMRGKPAPDIYLRSAQRLGIKPEKLIAVEDAASGIRSAHAAGYGSVLAVVTEDTRPDLENREDVNGVITDFTEFDRNLLLIP